MASSEFAAHIGDNRRDFIRLRTLIVLRWMAVAGQLTALLVAGRWLELQLPLGACLLAVGILIIANVISQIIYPVSTTLGEAQALLMLVFDLLQLAALLVLTGGINNPFAVLLLVPVTISAATLTLRSTLLLGIGSAFLTALMIWVHVPLTLADGAVLELPFLLQEGFALSLLTGTGFMALYARRVAGEVRAMSDALLAVQMALAREQKLTDLGGVVAAAAHELGTPLATIKLVGAEMVSELKDQPDLAGDAALIVSQADRCRDILRSMGRAGKEDRLVMRAPFGEVLRLAAEPHLDRGKTVQIALSPEDPLAEDRQPLVQRRAEVIHGIRNLVQNAVDFAQSKVWVDGSWSEDRITLRVVDDGPGYPPQMLGRIGDPFLRTKRPPEALLRPEYEGMGLGLFIAKTLLERTGAELTFANAADPFLDASERPERCGALVIVSWRREDFESSPDSEMGENRTIEP